ncbi:hypothetical protein H5410_035878 [Solanum commersonii]|uniref:Uncharacterized protein n=1 Tax=Solanum commersonii TaxID=4109 RepID=A0A9J5Y6H0_SOLCO|nr:hypothetical protein H5410_035878 [Solanum commersonii]
MIIPIRITHSVKRALDEGLITFYTNKSRSLKLMFIHPTDPIEISDEPDELTRAKKGKGLSSSSHTGDELQGKMKSDKFGVELSDDTEVTLDVRTSGFVYLSNALFSIVRLQCLLHLGEVNAPLQRLWASLAAKDAEIIALRASHLVAINQLHISYGLEHSGLEKENARQKVDHALD